MRKTIMKKLLLVLTILMVWCGGAWGATYYVRSDGTITNYANKINAIGPTTSADACLNLVAVNAGLANSAFSNGDILLFSDKGGVYLGAGANNTYAVIDISQNQAITITLQNAPGESPVFSSVGGGAGSPYLVTLKIAENNTPNQKTINLIGLTIQDAGNGNFSTPVPNSRNIYIYGPVIINATSLTIQNSGEFGVYQQLSAAGRGVSTFTNCTNLQNTAMAYHLGSGTMSIIGGSIDYSHTGIDNSEVDIISPYNLGPYLIVEGLAVQNRAGTGNGGISTSCYTSINNVTVNIEDGAPTGIVCVNAHFVASAWTIKNTTVYASPTSTAIVLFNIPSGAYQLIYGPNVTLIDTNSSIKSTGFTNRSSINPNFVGPNTISSCNLGIDQRGTGVIHKYSGFTFNGCVVGVTISTQTYTPVVQKNIFNLCQTGIYSFNVIFNAFYNTFVIPNVTNNYGINCPSAVTGARIFNNTFYASAKTNTNYGISMAQNSANNNTIKNNIFYGLNKGVLAGAANVSHYGSNDFYNTTTNTTGAGLVDDGGGLTVDPLFVSTSDFHLQPSSPAAKAGVFVPGVHDQPAPNNVDLGGVEFNSMAIPIGAYGVNYRDAILTGDFNLLVPFINYNDETYYWCNFAYIPNTMDFLLITAGVLSDINFLKGYTPSTLSNKLELHVPRLICGGISYWADFQYTDNGVFILTDAGLN